MTPIAFNEDNTLFFTTEMGVVLIITILILIIGTIHNCMIYDNDKNVIQMPTVLQIILSIFAMLSFTMFTDYSDKEKNKAEQIMLEQIQEAYNIDNLKTIEAPDLYCDNNYKGNIDAATWKEKDETTKIGLLIGQKKGNECRFILEETIQKHALNDK